MRKSKLSIVYEDEKFLVANKPQGLVTMGSKGEFSLYSLAQEHINKGARKSMLYVVHRLDQDTSGIVIFAKDRFTHKTLFEMFKNRRVQKYYKAKVSSEVQKLFSIEHWSMDYSPWLKFLRENKKQILEIKFPLFGLKNKSRVDMEKGKSAITCISIEQVSTHHTLLEVQTKTGRMHQIRVHLAYLGCPILGDSLYGHKSPSQNLCLHAERLEFIWPSNKRAYKFFAKCQFGI